jgi:hypothetical protein
MMHGLFHAFLEFAEYGGTTSGCRFRQCACYAPRPLEFALSDDVKNPHFEGGEGWCTSEFAGFLQKIHDSLLNIFPLSSPRSTPRRS